MLGVCYLAYIQTSWRNIHKSCRDQRTIVTQLCRCVNEISGAGQTDACCLKAESLMDPFCVDAGWDESGSKNITLKVQMIHLLPGEGLQDYVYAVASNLMREFLRLKLSAWHH